MGIFDKIFSREKKKETLDRGLEQTKEGFWGKLKRTLAGHSTIDDDFLDELEEVFITSDVGVETTVKIIDRIRDRVSRDKYVNTAELHTMLREEIAAMLAENDRSQAPGPDENFRLPEGVRKPYVIMVVGVNGAGKTTMVKLLMRFYDVDSGSITLNGHDIRDFDRSALREGFGMVLQDTWRVQGHHYGEHPVWPPRRHR